MTHSSVNKRLSVTEGSVKDMTRQSNNEDVFSFYQVQIFSPRFEFALNSEFMARGTMVVAIDEDEFSA